MFKKAKLFRENDSSLILSFASGHFLFLFVIFVLISKWTDVESWLDAIGMVLVAGIVRILGVFYGICVILQGFFQKYVTPQ